jgi:CBS domain-containing protein
MVGELMITEPKRCGPEATVEDLQAFFADDHVHAALVVDHDGRLLSVVLRSDLRADDSGATPAAARGQLQDRVVAPTTPVGEAMARLLSTGSRRLAVVGDDGAVLGLLCLKRSGAGFCSDEDVTARSVGLMDLPSS